MIGRCSLWLACAALMACGESPPLTSTPGNGSGGTGGSAGQSGGSAGAAGAPANDAGSDSASDADSGAPSYVWDLPVGFPIPLVPAENPMSEEKVQLGRHLFHDTRLSDNGTQSCASCHEQALAFTDGLTTSVGSTGQSHPRNSMPLANVAYLAVLTWGNPLMTDLEKQVLVPMLGTEPVELGLNGKEDDMLDRLRDVPKYVELFGAAYPAETDPFTLVNVVRALTSFERTLISGNSPYDHYVYGKDESALSEAAKRGLDAFNSEKLECFHCHSSFNLMDSVVHEGKPLAEKRFHNTALYNIDGAGAYPAPNTGIHELTLKPEDMGRFRTQSLRNVAVTAPYMHDGSAPTLDDAFDHYMAGGRTIASGPYAGVGSASPLKSPFMIGFTLTAEERADLVAFLESLTDDEFLNNPAFSNPWVEP